MTLSTLKHQFSMTLNESDLTWLSKKLRDEFDEHREPYQFDEDISIIEKTRRFGFHDLADSMQNDIMISAHATINNISR